MWIHQDEEEDKDQDMNGYTRIKSRIQMDKQLDIYEWMAGYKGYCRIYTRISRVEEDILRYQKKISFDIHVDIHSEKSFDIHNTYPLTYSNSGKSWDILG
jgi:hypothetical protein